MKLTIKNNSSRYESVNVLSALNFKIPPEINISLESDITDFDYKKLLNYISYKSIFIRFLGSTNNRNLWFYYMDKYGTKHAIEPYLNADKTKRPRWRGEKVPFDVFGGTDVYEGDLFKIRFTNKWDPKKWNIADTHEYCQWTFSNYVMVMMKPNEEFFIDFELMKP